MSYFSVRVNPDQFYWVRRMSAQQPTIPEGREPVSPTSSHANGTPRPPSYASEDGVSYALAAGNSSPPTRLDPPLPPHPSEVQRAWGPHYPPFVDWWLFFTVRLSDDFFILGRAWLGGFWTVCGFYWLFWQGGMGWICLCFSFFLGRRVGFFLFRCYFGIFYTPLALVFILYTFLLFSFSLSFISFRFIYFLWWVWYSFWFHYYCVNGKGDNGGRA